MKQDEFTTFIKHYASVLPGFPRWLARCQEDAQSSGIPITAADIMKRWWEQVEDIPLWAAQSAIRRALDRRELSDRDHERNILIIRDHSLEIMRTDAITDKNRDFSDYTCDLCRGIGVVLIHAPDNPLRRSSVACNCQRGDAVVKSIPRLRRFKPGHDKIWDIIPSASSNQPVTPSPKAQQILSSALGEGGSSDGTGNHE